MCGGDFLPQRDRHQTDQIHRYKDTTAENFLPFRVMALVKTLLPRLREYVERKLRCAVAGTNQQHPG
jgi:hypothetical protein